LILQGGCAENDTGDTLIQVKSDRLHIPDAAADLNGNIDVLHDIQNDIRVARSSGNRTVQINDVDQFRTLSGPEQRHIQGIVRIRCHTIKFALRQPHTFPIFDINRRNNNQLLHSFKIRRALNGSVGNHGMSQKQQGLIFSSHCLKPATEGFHDPPHPRMMD